MTSLLDASLVASLPADSLLGAFNRAGVLAPADVHVALRLGRLGSEGDEKVALAAALAVRAPRVGHVRVDLATVRETAEGEIEGDVEVEGLPWPEATEWVRRVAESPLVAVGDEGAEGAPLRLVGTALYLDRYWRDERAVASDLLARSVRLEGDGIPPGLLSAMIGELFTGDGDGEQRWAAGVGVLRKLAVIAGGPGTGKTTTVARLIALLGEAAEGAGREPPLVALAAPTGKAANRMQEAVRAAAVALAVSETVRERLAGLEAATVHRLLRPRPENPSRFRYHRGNRLPHDVIVVDETSMLPLWLMARLTEAVRPEARLVLVGDPRQLASVEAGAVLGDVVGPSARRGRMHRATSAELEEVTGASIPVEPLAKGESPIGDGVMVLRTNHRFTGALAALASAIESGDGDGTVEALSSGEESVRWLPVEVSESDPSALSPVREIVCSSGTSMLEAARVGDGAGALASLARSRVLCAHRRGPAGVATWNVLAERWLLEDVAGFSSDGEWYLGRPVIVTANDYGLRLFNGDSGVVVARREGGVVAAFESAPVSPSRLHDVDTVYAMTVHKAQGSEFDEVAVVLPQPGSRVLSRELLYTAVTRAKRRLVLVGSEESVRYAVDKPIARASGLTDRLWGAQPS